MILTYNTLARILSHMELDCVLPHKENSNPRVIINAHGIATTAKYYLDNGVGVELTLTETDKGVKTEEEFLI